MATGTLKQGGACTVAVSSDANAATPTWVTVNDVQSFESNDEFEFNTEEMACGRDEEAGVSFKFSGTIVSVDVINTNALSKLSTMEGQSVSGTANSGIKITAKDGSTYIYKYVRIRSRHFVHVPYNENIKYRISWDTQKRDTLTDILTFAT